MFGAPTRASMRPVINIDNRDLRQHAGTPKNGARRPELLMATAGTGIVLVHAHPRTVSNANYTGWPDSASDSVAHA